MNCPYCDEEMTGRCDCGSTACTCGYCPKCEKEVDGEDEEGVDDGDEE